MIKDIQYGTPLVKTYITEVEYSFIWSLQGVALDNIFVQTFNTTYGLARTVIPIPPLDEVPIYTLDAATWAYFKYMEGEGTLDCTKPCKLLTWPL